MKKEKGHKLHLHFMSNQSFINSLNLCSQFLWEFDLEGSSKYEDPEILDFNLHI